MKQQTNAKSQTIVTRQAQSPRVPPRKPKNADVRTREYLTASEIRVLKEAAAKAPQNGSRDWLLITMMYRHALRVSEATGLRWVQVDLKACSLHVNRLKNGTSAVHSLENDELHSLKQLRCDNPKSDFIFNSQRQGPLSARQVHTIVARAGKAAGIKFPVHPHQLRHAKGFQLAERGEETSAIQAYFGHKSGCHAKIYTRQLDSQQLKGLGKY